MCDTHEPCAEFSRIGVFTLLQFRDNFDEWYMCPLTIGGMMVSTAQAESDGTGISIRHPYIKSIRKNDIDPKDCTLSKILS